MEAETAGKSGMLAQRRRNRLLLRYHLHQQFPTKPKARLLERYRMLLAWELRKILLTRAFVVQI